MIYCNFLSVRKIERYVVRLLQYVVIWLNKDAVIVIVVPFLQIQLK